MKLGRIFGTGKPAVFCAERRLGRRRDTVTITPGEGEEKKTAQHLHLLHHVTLSYQPDKEWRRRLKTPILKEKGGTSTERERKLRESTHLLGGGSPTNPQAGTEFQFTEGTRSGWPIKKKLGRGRESFQNERGTSPEEANHHGLFLGTPIRGGRDIAGQPVINGRDGSRKNSESNVGEFGQGFIQTGKGGLAVATTSQASQTPPRPRSNK